MRALCVRVILGSATHYSNPGWVVLCEEWICQCVHLCICVRFLCLFGTQSYLPSIRSQVDMMLQIHQQPRFAVQFQWLIAMQQSTYPIATFVGEWNQSNSVCFLLVISNAAREFSRECQFKNAMVLESLESNAKLHHLALPTMLSALKHDWGILALFVVVNWSQPNHTRLAV